MSEKSNKYSPLMVTVVINASFTLLLIIFVAHQQIEIANLRKIVVKITENKADQLGTSSNISDQERTRSKEILPQVSNRCWY